MAPDDKTDAALPDQVTRLVTTLRDTGPGWAEFVFSYNDERYHIGISTFLGNVRPDVRRFYESVRDSAPSDISLYDEPGVSTLSVTAPDAEDVVVVECWTEYPYQKAMRELHLAMPRQMLLGALTAGIHPSVLAEEELLPARSQKSGSSRRVVITLLAVIGCIIALMVLTPV